MQISEPRQLAHKQVSFIMERPDGAAHAYWRMHIETAMNALTDAVTKEAAKLTGDAQMVTIDLVLSSRDQ